ncbi:MAG: SAM-dependent methyltransferase [Pseudomonadota bacterium]
MTDTRRPLFDSSALAAHRARANEDGMFLHDLAISLVKERLIEVSRNFEKPAIISWQAQRWADGLDLNATCLNADEVLPLSKDDGYDLMIHAFELHWMEDPIGQLIQMRRALSPDGLMIAVLFGAQTLTALRTALTKAEIAVRGGLSPRMAPLADLRDLGGLLQRAGYGLPVADNHLQEVSYATGINLMQDLRAMGETNALAGRVRHFTAPSVLRAAFNDLEGTQPLTVTFELSFLTGWAPSEIQQKPLKPGSATHSLAAILDEIGQKDRS